MKIFSRKNITIMVLILSMGILTLGYCVYTPRVKQPFTFDKSLTLGGYGCVAEITRTQAETFDGDTHDDYSRPVNTYLPKGTLDYCSGEIVSDSGKAYRGLLFGKRIYSEDAGIYYCRIPVDNKVSAKEYYVSGRHSYIEIGTLWKAPFSVRLNQQFYKEPKANPPDYSIDSQEFMYFDITFNYADEYAGTIDLSEDKIFSSMAWIKGEKSMTLRLYLKENGRFYGWGCYYNENADLVFYFLNPPVLCEGDNEYGRSLKNIKVMLDPGHSGEALGATAEYEGREVPEKNINLNFAKLIAEKLKSLGAQVVLTREDDTDMTLAERADAVRAEKPDLFLSLHRNFSYDSTILGSEFYYFYPWSAAPAKAIDACTRHLFEISRGVKFIHPMYVTRVSDCPCVLTETGFMSNQEELGKMLDAGHEKELADAVVRGIVEYLIFA